MSFVLDAAVDDVQDKFCAASANLCMYPSRRHMSNSSSVVDANSSAFFDAARIVMTVKYS